ncbi:hypothetical protein LZ554_001334 [Drepanopeziza brunnea f. sp. 'monogermtubi']|nr:hypothetical protein LZ554_001334 [Drepanopeziza brunnea f. sp. 'monogermtubi']
MSQPARARPDPAWVSGCKRIDGAHVHYGYLFSPLILFSFQYWRLCLITQYEAKFTRTDTIDGRCEVLTMQGTAGKSGKSGKSGSLESGDWKSEV